MPIFLSYTLWKLSKYVLWKNVSLKMQINAKYFCLFKPKPTKISQILTRYIITEITESLQFALRWYWRYKSNFVGLNKKKSKSLQDSINFCWMVRYDKNIGCCNLNIKNCQKRITLSKSLLCLLIEWLNLSF